MKKSVLAIALAVLMAVSLLTVGAMADGDTIQTENSVAKYENAGEKVTYFDTVGKAISAANAGGGGTITLLKDTTVGDNLFLKNQITLTLDLGNNTLTSTAVGGITIGLNGYETEGSHLTIKNGVYKNTNSQGTALWGFAGGSITIEKNAVIEAANTAYVTGDNSNTSGRTTINVYGEIRSGYVSIWCQGPNNIINIENAKIESKYEVVYHNYNYGGSKISIINSEVRSTDGYAIALWNKETNDYDTLNIENSSIIGTDIAVLMQYTNAEITGEETIITSDSFALAVTHNGNETTPGGTAGHLDIKAGKFVGEIEELGPTGDAENEAIVIVSGGEFDRPVDTEYLADGLNFELYSDNMYTYHKSMDEALKNAEPGDTITEVGAGTPAMEVYTVTLAYGNGQNDVTTLVQDGGTITLPTPTNSGYIFLGWRDNNNVTHKAGDVVPITADTTFVAVWGNLPDVKPSEPSEPETPVFPFYDVSARDWYYSAVKYVYEKGLMDGVDVGVFAPNNTLTRAMVWTIIARAEGVDTTGGATWYAKAQEWVTAKGISDGENPNAAITRQELVTMLYRLAGEPAVSGTITAPDAASVSTWAQSAMTWAMNIGLVEGDENGAVTPTATATRAQAAALIMRYLEA